MPAAPDAALDVDGWSELPVPAARVEDLHRARRRRRVAEVHWVDALYRAYLAAVVGVVVVVAVAGAVGGDPLTPTQVEDVERHGPALLGLVATLAVAIGLRSGSRGGPLAVEPGDVRHVLLAPVDRGRALRRPAVRQVRTAAFTSVLLGAIVGRFAADRFPGSTASWVAAGAAALATAAVLAYGTALLAGGRRLPRPAATALGAVLLAWSAADVTRLEVGGSALPASPGRAVGWLALAPLDSHWVSLVAVAAAALALGVGLLSVGGVSVEAAEQRTALVGQMRFAATLQDVRTVLVLRRQLAADRPRDRPWVRLPRRPARRPAWRRAVHGLLRFPAVRVVRLVLLAGAAGLVLRATWAGTAPVVVVAGLALWLAALDVVEPVAQEVDHPGRSDLYPVREGTLLVHLLVPSLVLGVLLGLLAGAVAVAPGAGQLPLNVGLLTGVATGVAAVAGAVTSVMSSSPSHDSTFTLIAPEVAGLRLVLRAVWPPTVAVLGALPLLIAVANDDAGRRLLQGVTTAWVGVAAVVGLALGWVHQRQEVLQWWREAMEASRQAATAPRTDADADDDDGPDTAEAADADDGPEEDDHR